MNDDEKILIFNKGIEEGKKHSKPSPESLAHHKQVDKFMEEIKKTVDNQCVETALLKQEMKMVKDQNTKDHEEIKSVLVEIKKSLSNLDDKYASKTFQTVVTKILWGVAIFVGGILGRALLDSIIKK